MLYKNLVVLSAIMLTVSGCAYNSAVSIQQAENLAPESWGESVVAVETLDDAWLFGVTSVELQQLLDKALKNNREIQQQRLGVKALEQSAIVSGASLWPLADLGFSSTFQDDSETGSLGLSFSYEFDIWGKLSANDRQANLQLASQRVLLELAEQDLIRDVTLAYFSVIENQQQLQLNKQRLTNTQQNLAIIESGYESGLNSALDVYLTRNEVANEQARVANQDSAFKASVRNLELLVGEYPSGVFKDTAINLPEVNHRVSALLPAEVIKNLPSLKASWLSLMAKDAGVAFAYKNRFPSISLTGNVGLASQELSELFSSDGAWSLTARITQPIFYAGRLKANEEKARLETQQAEQAYLSSVNAAFSEVENRLTQAENLTTRYQANLSASENADLAESLSFEQYLKGLVSYTTVLDAQTRAFNAKSAVIEAKYQLLENHLNLHRALGGQFNSIISSGSN